MTAVQQFKKDYSRVVDIATLAGLDEDRIQDLLLYYWTLVQRVDTGDRMPFSRAEVYLNRKIPDLRREQERDKDAMCLDILNEFYPGVSYCELRDPPRKFITEILGYVARRISPRAMSIACSYFLSGRTMKDISKQYNISTSWVHLVLRRFLRECRDVLGMWCRDSRVKSELCELQSWAFYYDGCAYK